MVKATRWVARWTAALAAAAALVAAMPVLGAPEPVDHFTRPAAIDGVVVSPSGKRLAVLLFGPNGRRQLSVMNLDPVGEARMIGGFADADVVSVPTDKMLGLIPKAGPMMSKTATVSPRARPRASSVPPMIPPRPQGETTVRILPHSLERC